MSNRSRHQQKSDNAILNTLAPSLLAIARGFVLFLSDNSSRDIINLDSFNFRVALALSMKHSRAVGILENTVDIDLQRPHREKAEGKVYSGAC